MNNFGRLLWIAAPLLLLGNPARALDFSWWFANNAGDPSTGGITSGTISGLVEGSNAIGSAGIALTVQQSVNLPGSTPFTFYSGPTFNSGTINVSGGVVDYYQFYFSEAVNNYVFQADQNSVNAQFGSPVTPADRLTGGLITFTPSTGVAVPAPLPVAGASAGFLLARRLRRRVAQAGCRTLTPLDPCSSVL